jgi:hypothetical protein
LNSENVKRLRPAQDGSGISPEESAKETNELALISLALGVFWLFGFGSIAAIYLGRKALGEIAQVERHESGRAFAWAGIASGVFGLMSTGLVIAVAITA